MTMQWLEGEFRKGIKPGDFKRADKMREMLIERGEDVSLPGEVINYKGQGEKATHLPRKLSRSQIVVLSEASKFVDEYKAPQQFTAEQIFGLIRQTDEEFPRSTLYHILGRLINWEFLAVNKIVQKRSIMEKHYVITEAGLQRISREPQVKPQ